MAMMSLAVGAPGPGAPSKRAQQAPPRLTPLRRSRLLPPQQVAVYLRDPPTLRLPAALLLRHFFARCSHAFHPKDLKVCHGGPSDCRGSEGKRGGAWQKTKNQLRGPGHGLPAAVFCAKWALDMGWPCVVTELDLERNLVEDLVETEIEPEVYYEVAEVRRGSGFSCF